MNLFSLFSSKEKTLGIPRSDGWNDFRDSFIKGKSCSYCLTTKRLELHHILPFHKFPDKEFDTDNLIVLCRIHHFEIGHFYSWSSWNGIVKEDCAKWQERVNSRPN